MNLRTENWKVFYLKNLYEIRMGNGFDKNKMSDEAPSVNFVSRISYGNGVDCIVDYVDGIEPFEEGLLTVALGGSYLGSCFVQERPFYTGQNVAVMTPVTNEMSHSVNLFISGLVRYESKVKYYAFGRELNSHINRDFSIKLPIQQNVDGTPFVDNACKYSKEGYVPDWKWMEDYIKSLHHKPLTTKNKKDKIPNLLIDDWKEFKVGHVFNCETTSLSIKDDLSDGNVPFISRTAENNGCDGYVEIDCDKITKGNCLTIGAEGIYSFYQPIDFATGNKVYQLRNENMNPHIALFLATILNLEDYRYSYGRARILSKLKEEIIKLPIQYNEDGTPYMDNTYKYSEEGYVPNWRFMEDYIKSLPYGDRI